MKVQTLYIFPYGDAPTVYEGLQVVTTALVYSIANVLFLGVLSIETYMQKKDGRKCKTCCHGRRDMICERARKKLKGGKNK